MKNTDILGKVFRTEIPEKRKRGRLKIRWNGAIKRDLETYWIESERGGGQGDME